MKKLISILLSMAMLMSVIVVPTAYAATTTYYTQDYESVADTSKLQEFWSSTNYAEGIVLGTDNTNYAQYSCNSQVSRGVGTMFSATPAENIYAVEFDLALTKSSKDGVQFAVCTGTVPTAQTTVSSNFVFKIDMAGATNDCVINDIADATVTLTDSAWYHYSILVDKENSLASVTITDASGNIKLDKCVVSTNGATDKITGIYFLSGRYNSMMKIDNIVVRSTDESDVFGDRGEETLNNIEWVSQLNTTINQPAEGAPVHKQLQIKANGIYGGDLTDADGLEVKWSVVGLDNEDGYISLTKAAGTGAGTDGETPDGTTAYFNVRNGVSNWFGSVAATVTYLGKTLTISTPFAVIGAGSAGTNIAPKAGYPESMNDYDDALVGYTGTSNGLTTQDIVLNNWSMFGSNGARYLMLSADEDGTKYIRFATNGGSGSAVPVYQLANQTSQYIVDMKVRFTGGNMTFGHYYNTPNNTGNNPNWTCSYSGGALTAGTQSISGINSTGWYRVVVSADESAGMYWAKVYNDAGALVGEISDEALLTTYSNGQKYFCFQGSYPLDLASFRVYKPTADSLTINTDAETIQVPEGATPSTVSLAGILKDTDGYNMTGALTWSLDEEYTGVSIDSDGTQNAVLTVTNEASAGDITVVASYGSARQEKKLTLSTTGNSMAFTTFTSSMTIPFMGEENVTATFAAEARNKDGVKIDGSTAAYEMINASGEVITNLRGVTFNAETGVLTVEPNAAAKVVYIKATSVVGEGTDSEILTSKVKVNIHGLSFKFGSDEPTDDSYTQVTSADAYTDRLGYGFADTSVVTDAAANVKGTADYRFKAKVPNGNYVVNVTTSSGTMTSEVVESVTATTGISKSGSRFNVAVCDGVLDLTFTSGSTLTELTIVQAAEKTALSKPAVYAIGDSTTNNSSNGNISWGNVVGTANVPIPDVFSGFSNNGMAGRDSVNFYNQGRVEAVLLNICPGDYVTVNMGINSKETGEAASYETLLSEYYVDGIIQRGGIPVIVAATPQGPVGNYATKNYSNGVFTCNRGDGARNDVLRRIASEKNLNIIELGLWGDEYFNSLTEADATAAGKSSVLELVQSWYGDHNHYRDPLASNIANYILGCVAQLAEEAAKPSVEASDLKVETTKETTFTGVTEINGNTPAEKKVDVKIAGGNTIVTVAVKMKNTDSITRYTLTLKNDGETVGEAVTSEYKTAIDNIGLIQVVLEGEVSIDSAQIQLYNAASDEAVYTENIHI